MAHLRANGAALPGYHGGGRRNAACPHNREAACVGIVLLDPLTGFVLQEAIEDVGRFVRGRRDDLRGEGRVLIRDVAVSGQPWLVPVSGVDHVQGFPRTPSGEVLAVRG